MSIDGIIESLYQAGNGSSRSLVFQSDGDFASILTLGQIIKGKVMRHYEGHRYGIEFNGREKVVDTTFPLKNGEVLYARVIGIDEKIHLQRIVGDPERENTEPAVKYNSSRNSGQDVYQDSIRTLFDRYQVKLSSEALRLILQLQNSLDGSRQVAVSALILSKLGVVLDPGLIRALHRVLADELAGADKSFRQHPVHSIPESADIPREEMIESLAALVARISDKGPMNFLTDSVPVASQEEGPGPQTADGFSFGGDSGQGGERDHLEWFLGQWLLNVQTEGAVAHRFIRFPMWFGGQLTEVSMALFAQSKTSDQTRNGIDENLRYRNVVFALDTADLGHLEIKAKLADQHVRIELAADNPEVAEYLAGGMALLKSALSAYGWKVDEIHYRVLTDPGGPLQAVVEHYVAQDSLNRLL